MPSMTILPPMAVFKSIVSGVRLTPNAVSDYPRHGLGALLAFAGPARRYPATTAAAIENASWNGVGRQLAAAKTKAARERSTIS